MESIKDLYIYWINRALTAEEEAAFGRSYIGNWLEDDLSFLFFTEDARKAIENLIEKANDLKIIEQYYIPYEQWQGVFYDPIRISKFLIIPIWYKKTGQIEDGLIPIFLDPGVVFGNCLHPTTQHCIEAICWVAENYPIKNVLDIGTGTGILAIVAAKLGAEKVIALDINPLCIKTANKNVVLNGVENKIRLICGRAEEVRFKEVDLIVANLSYEIISKLIDFPGFLNKGIAILSGMLRSQWSDIRERLIKDGCEIVKEWDYEMIWYTSIIKRK